MGKSRHQSHPSSDDGEFGSKKKRKHSMYCAEQSSKSKNRQRTKRLLKDFSFEDEDDGPFWEEF